MAVATALCNNGFSFAAFPPLLAAFFSIDLGAPKIGSLLTLTSSLQHRSIIAALWVATRQFVHERSGLPPPSLAPPSIYPSFLSPQLSLQLAKQAYSLIPSYFQPMTSLRIPSLVTPGRHQDHTVSRVLTLEQEGHPQFHGPVPVLAMSVPDAFPICILPSDSPVIKHLFRFQQLCPRVPNCCSSGSALAGIFMDISILFFPYSRTPPSTLVTHQPMTMTSSCILMGAPFGWLGFSPLPANRLNSFLLVLRCRFSYRNIRISGRHDACFENQFKLATFLVLLRCWFFECKLRLLKMLTTSKLGWMPMNWFALFTLPVVRFWFDFLLLLVFGVICHEKYIVFRHAAPCPLPIRLKG